MTFVYICAACQQGDHAHCEEVKDLVPEDSELCGGGHCVCPHDRVYESPDDVWKRLFVIAEAVSRSLDNDDS